MAQQLSQMEMYVRSRQRALNMAETDPEVRAVMPDADVVARLQNPDASLQQIVAAALSGYADRNATGTRAYEVITDEQSGDRVRAYLPAYRHTTYKELREQVEAVANFLTNVPAHRVQPGEMIAYLAFSGTEMLAVDLAGIYVNSIGVPLQPNTSRRDLDEILGDTRPVTMVASVENLALAADVVLAHESFRSLIVIDADPTVDAERRAINEVRELLAKSGGRIAFTTFQDAVAEGSGLAFAPPARSPEGRDALVMLMYTSGSTGTPKGAMVHEGILAHNWGFMGGGVPCITFNYAPLYHFMGRNALYATLAQGGTAYFTLRSDLSTILEDIRLARPLSLGLIPRICELVQQHYLSEVQRLTTGGTDAETADRAVRIEMKTFLGDRLTACTIGSAPTTPELRQLLSDIFQCPVVDGFGSTEVGGGGITFDNRIVPHSVLDYKLVDVPELGYYTSDKPFPRGELLVKTKTMIKGYYKRPDATAAIYDPDGFLRTGDIMEQRGEGILHWLDRRNNVMKLAQGEFVAVGPLETLYLNHCKLIDQLYLYGTGQRPFLLGVVVPDFAYASALLGHEPNDEEVRQLVLDEMREAARAADLRVFEIPRDVLIERTPFTQENGLLSGVNKPLRPHLRDHYSAQLEAIYDGMDRQADVERDLLRQQAEQPTVVRVAGAVKLSISLAELSPNEPQSYYELGGDSLGAVNLSLLLEEVFGVPVPVSMLLHPAANVQHIAAQIDALLVNAGAAARYDVIHPNPEQIAAKDLKLEALFDEDTLQAAAVAAPAVASVRTVLLTGANGYLGRFLCMEWLERLAERGGKLICLVRGRDDAQARDRLERAIGTQDAALAERFQGLAQDHLEVLAADLAAPRLGLDEATYDRLADEVDQIVHPAALVNHRLAYRNLFEPNVMGTAELVRLALTDRIKRFDYVSSVAVTHLNPELARSGEDADVREKAPVAHISGDYYAQGYAASKWAGEIILREANERFDLPVNVYRADMILPHSRYIGQFNVADTFTRLVLSVAMTAIAPKSFYQLGPDGERQSAHYDGLPVDFIAAVMQQASERNGEGFHSYNIMNVHQDDGISLDTIVDWMISAGYEVTRIDGYEEWLRRFEEKLRNLPDERRQHSSLSVLGNLRSAHPASYPLASFARFEGVVREIAAGPEIPHLSEAYIHKFLRDLQLAELIEAPVAVG
jgi:fatty acid CoA ligase FadD9